MNVQRFFSDIEDVLAEHLGKDWHWSYASNKPLEIISSTLAEAWIDKNLKSLHVEVE